MRLIGVFLILILLEFSCKSKIHPVRGKGAGVVGCWKKTDSGISYPTLSFSRDSTAIFSSVGDTVYRMKYWLDGTNLYLSDRTKIFTCPIIELTGGTLYFIDSLGKGNEILYIRDSCSEIPRDIPGPPAPPESADRNTIPTPVKRLHSRK